MAIMEENQQKKLPFINRKSIKLARFWKMNCINNKRHNPTQYFKHVKNTIPYVVWTFLEVQECVKNGRKWLKHINCSFGFWILDGFLFQK